jgi:hypothetical protein
MHAPSFGAHQPLSSTTSDMRRRATRKDAQSTRDINEMKTILIFAIAAVLVGPPSAQEEKRVPKNSIRVFVPGCSKGRIFTAGRHTEDLPGGSPIPEGMHLRMNGPKKVMAAIKGQEGSRIEITGLMRKEQFAPTGVVIGGVRITPGLSAPRGSLTPSAGINEPMIDVEGWRRVLGDCPSR